MSTQKCTKKAASTSRDSGAVGNNPLVYKLFRTIAKEESFSGKIKCLDFGAGKTAKHTKKLRKEGFNVTAFDLPENMNPDVHDVKALSRTYDIVLLSNVLNVWPSVEDISDVLKQIYSVMHMGSMLICNFPKDPRHSHLTNEDFLSLLKKLFYSVSVVQGKETGMNTILLKCLKYE